MVDTILPFCRGWHCLWLCMLVEERSMGREHNSESGLLLSSCRCSWRRDGRACDHALRWGIHGDLHCNRELFQPSFQMICPKMQHCM